MATADRETTDREPESPRTPESPALPNARLNPLLNPLLAKQLGRWAHIYYTASVDKREAAIEKLVSELEAEENRLNGGGRTESPRETLSPSTVKPNPADPIAIPEGTSAGSPQGRRDIPETLRVNAPAAAAASLQPSYEAPPSQHVRDSQPDDILFPESRLAEPQGNTGPGGVALHRVSIHDVPRKQRLPETESSALIPEPHFHNTEQGEGTVPESIPASWQELLGGTGGVSGSDRRTAPDHGDARLTSESHPDDDPYVSRDAVAYSHAFDDILAQSEQIQGHHPPARNWRLPMIVATVLGVLGGSFWLVQSERLRPGALEQSHRPVAPAAQQSDSQAPVVRQDGAEPPMTSAHSPTTSAPGTVTPGNSAPSSQAPQASGTPHVATTPATTGAPIIANHDNTRGSNPGTQSPIAPPAQTSPASASEVALPPPDADFEAGMRELQGPQRNSADAARHLWLSVKNQNSFALIPLAQLYANGDGVTKDCDQAKVLLDAATRQAKSRTQFLKAEMSRASLRTAGCE